MLTTMINYRCLILRPYDYGFQISYYDMNFYSDPEDIRAARSRFDS